MKKLLLLLTISLFVISCSSDSDEGTNGCAVPSGLQVDDITNSTARFYWQSSVPTSIFQVQYGPAGFAVGSGTTVSSSNPSKYLENLQAETQYDVYVRAYCNDIADYSAWAGPYSFITIDHNPFCETPTNFNVDNLSLTGISHDYIELDWANGSFDGCQVQYGTQNFNLGTGTIQNVTDDIYPNGTTINNLNPNTSYDFYVRNICENSGYSNWIGPITGTTKPAPLNENCLDPLNFTLDEIYTISGQDYLVFSWDGLNGENTWQLHKVVAGNPFSTGETLDTSYNPIQLTNHTTSGVTYDFYVRAFCGVDGHSDWVGPITLVGP
jgi:hypothetical protein